MRRLRGLYSAKPRAARPALGRAGGQRLPVPETTVSSTGCLGGAAWLFGWRTYLANRTHRVWGGWCCGADHPLRDLESTRPGSGDVALRREDDTSTSRV